MEQTQLQCFEAFKEGLGSVFRQWTALELAVDQRWGGSNSSDKANELMNKTLELFSPSKKTYKDEIVLLLEDYMEIEFNTICEDESAAEVAELLLLMWRQCGVGDFSLVTNALAREFSRHEVLSRSQGMVADGDSDSDDDETEDMDSTMMTTDDKVEVPDVPKVDPDGWETVARGKKKR
eukprot:gene9795-20383_t